MNDGVDHKWLGSSCDWKSIFCDFHWYVMKGGGDGYVNFSVGMICLVFLSDDSITNMGELEDGIR